MSRPSRRGSSSAAPVKQEFDDEYRKLRKKYLEPRVYADEALAMGAVLRTKKARAVIDQPGGGAAYRALKSTIKRLEKAGDHVSIFGYLKQLEHYYQHPVLQRGKGYWNSNPRIKKQ